MALGAGSNLALCWLTSAAAGLGAGFFSCVLSVSDKMKQKNNGKYTRRSMTYLIVGILGSTLFGFGSILGLFFGPITSVTVIRAGTTLPSNAIFSQLMGLRPLVRDDYLGTLSCICGVICFASFQGVPQALTQQLFFEYFWALPSLVWNAGLLVLMLFAASVAYCVEGGARTPTRRFSRSPTMNQTLKALAVALFIACSSSIMDVAGKCWLAVLKATRNDDVIASSPAFWIAFLTNALFLVAMRVGTIYGCAKCDVLLFVPLNTMLNVFLSVATGIVVLNEGKEVYSWVGLITSVITVVGGILMLVTGPADATEEALDDSAEADDAIARSFLSNLSQPISTPLIPVATPIRSFPIRSFQEQLHAATFPGSQSGQPCHQNHLVHLHPGASTPPSCGSPLQQQQQQQQHLQQQQVQQHQQLQQQLQEQFQHQQRPQHSPHQTHFNQHHQHQPQHQHPHRQPLISGITDLERGQQGSSIPPVPSMPSGHHTELSLPSTESLDEAISCVSWMVMQENLLQMNNWHQQAASWRMRHHKEWESLRKIVRDFREHAEEAQGYALQLLADMPAGDQSAVSARPDSHNLPPSSNLDRCQSPPRTVLQSGGAGLSSSPHEGDAFVHENHACSTSPPLFASAATIPSFPSTMFPSSCPSTSATASAVVPTSLRPGAPATQALEVDNDDNDLDTSSRGSRPVTPQKRPSSRPTTPGEAKGSASERSEGGRGGSCSLRHLTPPIPFGSRPRSGSGGAALGRATPSLDPLENTTTASSVLSANDVLEESRKPGPP